LISVDHVPVETALPRTSARIQGSPHSDIQKYNFQFHFHVKQSQRSGVAGVIHSYQHFQGVRKVLFSEPLHCQKTETDRLGYITYQRVNINATKKWRCCFVVT